MRPSRFLALARPALRRNSIACSSLPFASVSAFLHSIIPAPVFSRRALTISEVIAIATSISYQLIRIKFASLLAAFAKTAQPRLVWAAPSDQIETGFVEIRSMPIQPRWLLQPLQPGARARPAFQRPRRAAPEGGLPREQAPLPVLRTVPERVPRAPRLPPRDAGLCRRDGRPGRLHLCHRRDGRRARRDHDPGHVRDRRVRPVHAVAAVECPR